MAAKKKAAKKAAAKKKAARRNSPQLAQPEPTQVEQDDGYNWAAVGMIILAAAGLIFGGWFIGRSSKLEESTTATTAVTEPVDTPETTRTDTVTARESRAATVSLDPDSVVILSENGKVTQKQTLLDKEGRKVGYQELGLSTDAIDMLQEFRMPEYSDISAAVVRSESTEPSRSADTGGFPPPAPPVDEEKEELRKQLETLRFVIAGRDAQLKESKEEREKMIRLIDRVSKKATGDIKAACEKLRGEVMELGK